MRKNKIVIIDGERYQIYKCLNCGNEIRFKIRHNLPVRVHGACSQCGKVFEVFVDPR